MADQRAVFRLGLAPVLLLGWNMAAENPLPFLGPSLLVTVLAGSSQRPPLAKLAGGVAFLVGLSWLLARLFVTLADAPAVAWIVLLAVAVAAFARLARRPGDMLAMLALICASVVVTVIQLAADLGTTVPWLLGSSAAQAVVAALIAHALLPSASPGQLPANTSPARGEASLAVPVTMEQGLTKQAVGRGVALVVVLGLALHLEDNSAVLIALTAVNVLAAPATLARGRVLLLANAAAAAATLPLLVVAAVLPDPAIMLLLALAGGLWMASGLDRAGTPQVIAREGLPVFVVLLGLLLPKAGEALPVLMDRLLTLGLVILYSLGVRALLSSSSRAAGVSAGSAG